QAAWRPTFFSEMVQAGAAVSESALQERQATVRTTDPAMMLYTSGTTGFPKGAILTHHNLVNNAAAFATRWGVQDHDRSCSAMPYFHAGGCVLAVLGALCANATMHPLIAFDAHKMLEVLSSEHCTTLGGVPTMLLAMLQQPDFASFDLSALRTVISGGAPVPAYLMEQVKEHMGADVAIVFGQTECSAAMTLTPPDDSFALKSATVGITLPHIETKVINPATGATVACGERGELCCRGYLVMQGYYQMPEKTTETIDSAGWLHTGDLATMDAQGYVNIVGRLKEMVIRGGENIFPREIEEFLIRHPHIADVSVVGVPDPFFGEELLAVIVLQPGEELSEETVRAYCKGQISHQKIPRYIQFAQSFPLTASGKVQKFVLREQAMQQLGL
ncbi:MAG: AMP-binding protein, partial [Ktedonobacteraceae bacterium]